MSILSPEAYRMLSKAGWKPERRDSMDHYESGLLLAGFEPIPAVSEFLSRFKGINLAGSVQHAHKIVILETRFDAVIPNWDWFRKFRKWSKEFIHEDVLPIGEQHMSYIMLVMDRLGQVYGNTDDYLWKIATSAEDLMNAIVLGREPIEEYGDDRDGISGQP